MRPSQRRAHGSPIASLLGQELSREGGGYRCAAALGALDRRSKVSHKETVTAAIRSTHDNVALRQSTIDDHGAVSSAGRTRLIPRPAGRCVYLPKTLRMVV